MLLTCCCVLPCVASCCLCFTPCSAARDFVEENKVAAVAAAARRPVKAEAKSAGGAGEYLHKSEYGQVCLQGAVPGLEPWCLESTASGVWGG
jgi:hypothetical protein